MESRTVLVAAIGTIGSTALVSTTDNSAATARDLGTLAATPTTVSDFVGSADTQDYSRFTIARTSDFTLRLSGLTSDADVQLQNAQGQSVASSVRGGNLSEDISRSLDAGTYYVRVYQYSGDTNYDLTLSAVASTVANDNSTAGARDLGTIGATPTIVNDFVGNSDTQDYFRFTVTPNNTVNVRLTGLSADANVELLDAFGIVWGGSYRGGNAAEDISRSLQAGTYFVRVYQSSGDTNYSLSVSATSNDVNLGVISATPTQVTDSVGGSNSQDYYCFTVSNPSEVSLRLTTLGPNVWMQLWDAQGQSIMDLARDGASTRNLTRVLSPGTYRIRVFNGDFNAVIPATVASYTLSVTATQNDNSTALARNLGTLSDTPQTIRDFVGSSDTQDFFRFTVAEPRLLSMHLSGLSSDADLQLLDSRGAVIVSSARGGTAADHIDRDLAAGTYFVRVYQFSGNTNYDLALAAVMTNDNSISTARDVGTLSGTPTTVQNSVGNLDLQDYMRFSVPQPSDVTLRLTGMTADADLRLLNAQGIEITNAIRRGNANEEIIRGVDPGTYFVSVSAFSGETSYGLALSAVPSDNTLATARDLGALGNTPLTASNFVGTIDSQDWYRFTVAQTQNVSIRQIGAGYGADLELLDASGRVITGSTYVATAIWGIDRSLEPGTYFVRAFQLYGEVNYNLTVSVNTPVANDDSIATAREFGAVGTTPTTIRDFVGNADRQDYFRFTLAESRSVRLELAGMSADADIEILDAQGQVIAGSYRWSNASEQITRILAAGTYFVRVVQYSGDTNYDLTLSAT